MLNIRNCLRRRAEGHRIIYISCLCICGAVDESFESDGIGFSKRKNLENGISSHLILVQACFGWNVVDGGAVGCNGIFDSGNGKDVGRQGIERPAAGNHDMNSFLHGMKQSLSIAGGKFPVGV